MACSRASGASRWSRWIVAFAMLVLWAHPATAQVPDTAKWNPVVRGLLREGMWSSPSYGLLAELVTKAPHRLSGSSGAATAVTVIEGMMQRLHFQNVRRENVIVPHWVRGSVEKAEIRGRHPYGLNICALGGSVGTPGRGITAGVVEVHSLEEARALGPKGKGKIIFFNRPMDASKVNTFEAYEGAVDQRGEGAIEAGRVGGVAAIVRSMTLRHDAVPHTGVMGYDEHVPKVPAAAVSTIDADTLSARLKRDPSLTVKLVLDCTTLPDASSANVLGEIVGSDKPEDIIVVGGHLDCWDKGVGAVDDGSGCVQAIEALRLINALGVHPKKTIRAVAFMNEENGNRGGRGYVENPARTKEHHLALIESDRGGFAPMGFELEGDSAFVAKTVRWSPLFSLLEASQWGPGFSGVDITPMVRTGVPGFGLVVESERYFDYHHSANDQLSAINPRELELGAVAEAFLCLLISEEGL